MTNLQHSSHTGKLEGVKIVNYQPCTVHNTQVKQITEPVFLSWTNLKNLIFFLLNEVMETQVLVESVC